MARLDPRTRSQLLCALCEGVSFRSCQRIFGVEQNTVDKLLTDAGDMAIAHVEDLKNLSISKIQADELYAFVAARERNVGEMEDPPDGAGTVWGYLAMCADSKLIFSYLLGDRTDADAKEFMVDVASKLKRTETGAFWTRPHIATDGFEGYKKAVEHAFGADAGYGMLVKSYSKPETDGNLPPGSRYTGSERKPVSGDPRKEDVHTSYIERQNLNLRMGNRRYNRRTNAFSKRMLSHERQLALWIMYHNYCWVPRPMRPRAGSGQKGWIKRLPAAMEAGLTKHIWEVPDLLALTDAFVAERRRHVLSEKKKAKAEAKAALKAAKAKARRAGSDEERAPFWVYVSFVHHSAKVHRTACTNCNDGHGKKLSGKTKSGTWVPFGTLAHAEDYARAEKPDLHSICNMCLGTYRTRGYGELRGPQTPLRFIEG
jgi:IS1 family transposase